MHYGRTADVVEARSQSPLDDAIHRFQYVKAAVGLAHLYIGYAVLARTVATLD
jgi:hypothetical protein